MNTYLNTYFSERSNNGFLFDSNTGSDSLLCSTCEFATVKTGTTIVGVACNDCVVLGADTRATNGPIVADKDCDKIHRLSDSIFAAGAGTAADLDHVTSLVEGNLELQKLQMNKKPRVASAVSMLSNHLYKYQGYIGAHLIVAGSDSTGNYVFQVSANGCIMQLPFTSMGSGSLCARSILEARYRDGLTENECVELVSAAIRAGIYNDLYSGSNVNILIIKSNSVKHFRHFDTNASERIYRQPKPISFPIGATPIISKKTEDLSSFVVEISEVQIEDENMD